MDPISAPRIPSWRCVSARPHVRRALHPHSTCTNRHYVFCVHGTQCLSVPRSARLASTPVLRDARTAPPASFRIRQRRRASIHAPTVPPARTRGMQLRPAPTAPPARTRCMELLSATTVWPANTRLLELQSAPTAPSANTRKLYVPSAGLA
jgi:hypothetical protein